MIKNIVKDNEGLNFILNEIVNNEMDKTLDEMIAVVEDFKMHSDVISCETIIEMLKTNKSK